MRFFITHLCLLCATGILLFSCNFRRKDYPQIIPEAYVPVYDNTAFHVVQSQPVQKTVSPGKMYVYDHLLFQVESLKGVHVISYVFPSHPVKLGFIKSRGCSEVAYKNGYLVINNMDDLVFLDVHDPAAAKEVSRVAHAFPNFNAGRFENDRPPVPGKYFVCPDYTKGDIVRWELQKDVKSDCFNNTY